MKKSASSSNATRALDIMLVLGEAGPEGLSLAEIATSVACEKSAAHRTLVAMLGKGFVEQAPQYGHYRLGTAIPMLARRQERLEPQVQRLRPGMTKFARETGFTTYLLLQSGTDAVCAEMISRSSRQQFTMGVGARVPMGVGAGSLALLSLLPEAVVKHITESNDSRYQEHPSMRPVDKSLIQQLVRDAKTLGYAINPGLFFFGEGGVALPLPAGDHYGVNMAVSFNAPLELMVGDWVEQRVEELRDCFALEPALRRAPRSR